LSSKKYYEIIARLSIRRLMKSDIHPPVFTSKIACSCGQSYSIGNTTVKDFHIEVCGACHPHYTGKQKLVDTAGRVDKFNKKLQVAGKGS